MGRARYARSLSAFLLVAVTALFSLPSVTTGSAGSAAPGTEDRLSLAAAGVPEAGVPLFSEDFSNQNAATTGVSILSYTGAAGMTYTADPQYTPAGGQCNGWVMSSTTALPTADAGCANNQPDGWNQLRAMAADLGLAQGQSAAQAASNQVLTEYTNAPSGTIAAGYELKTNSGIQAVAGHYYAVSAYFAEVNCFSNHASMTFSLIVNGTPTVLSSGLDPCTAPGGTTYADGTRVVKLQSAAIQMPPTGTPSLGLQLFNARANGNGNDVSFDLPQIVDVTPSLDKAFSPTTVTSCPTGAATCPPSSVSTLTFTVTNTTDLQAKPDWNFTDNLPAGVRVAPTPNVGGTCTSTTGAALVRTAAAGSTSISVTGGDLALGQASCTVTVDVVSATPGTYTNDATNVTTNLVPPDPAVLTVVDPSTIRVQKDLPDGRRVASDQFTVTVTGGGITTGNTGTTAGTDTGVQATAAETAGPARGERGTTYTVTETGAAGAQLSDYTSTWRCVDTANGSAVVASGNGATGTFTMPTAPVRSDILCTFTNVPKLPDINIKKTAGATPVISGPDAAGNYTVKYQVTVTNSGDGNGSYGALVDTPAFSANLTPLGATWTTSGAGAPAGGSDASAPYALTSGTTSIGAGVTHTYDMVLTFRFTDGKPATTCAGSGTGLFNTPVKI